MSEITTTRTHTDLTLTSAILLYGSRESVSYATVHPILNEAKTERPLIGAGRPLNRKTLLGALRSLSEASTPKAEFLPPNVLGFSPDTVTWWCPPALRRVFFDCKEMGGVKSAVVPHPGLVFQASATGFSVFALADALRPEAGSTLYEPPYFNTWDCGRICIGSARVPRRIDLKSVDGWEAGFFDSAFTHPNAGGRRINYADGEYAFWRDMLDGQFGERFPLDVLVPTKMKVAQFVAGKIGGAA